MTEPTKAQFIAKLSSEIKGWAGYLDHRRNRSPDQNTDPPCEFQSETYDAGYSRPVTQEILSTLNQQKN